MTPALASLIIQYALQYGIPAARQIIALINKPDPTAADWNAAFDTAETAAKAFLARTSPLAAKV